MFAIIGAAGKVGFATSVALRDAEVPVRAILRDESKSARLLEIGCDIAIADLQDPEGLAQAISGAETVQIIVPPSVQAKDGAQDMRDTIESLGTALEKARPKRVLVISDYGAHVDHDIGMPTMCGTLEARVRQIAGHVVILRSAEQMQNWGRAIPAALASGTLPSFLNPTTMRVPFISAPDVGQIAAQILLRPAREGSCIEIFHAEGPSRYSASDVASTLSQLTGQDISVEIVPRTHWKAIFERGMSASLAELLIKANDAHNKGGSIDVEQNSGEVFYGTTDLVEALHPMIPSR